MSRRPISLVVLSILSTSPTTKRSTHMILRKLLVGAGTGVAALTLALAGTAGADERASKNQGVGVCMSQVAINPEFVDAPRLGSFARSLAKEQQLVAELDGLRNACGEPPGPGHLGG